MALKENFLKNWDTRILCVHGVDAGGIKTGKPHVAHDDKAHGIILKGIKMVLNSFIKDRLLGSARSQIKKYIKKRVLSKLPDDKVSFIERDGSISIRTTTEFADDLITETGKMMGNNNMGKVQIAMVGVTPNDIANIIRQEFKEYDRKHNKK